MKKPLLLLASAALLFLASCSSEPSDWRSEEKVSLDVIPPGTRVSDNFDQNTSATSSDEKGGAIATPHPVLQGNLTRRAAPTAGAVMSADTKPENAAKSPEKATSSQQADAKAEKEKE
jgi:hypothetical protein